MKAAPNAEESSETHQYAQKGQTGQGSQYIRIGCHFKKEYSLQIFKLKIRQKFKYF